MPAVTNEPIISSLESDASLGVIMTEQGPLPLRSVSIRSHIDQLFAEVQVRQGYVNSHPDTIEATYIFPLPDRAAVTRFQAKLGNRLIEGILKERGAARREYAEAIQKGHRAAIAEEERSNVFTMRIGNILPGESAEIELTLCMPLAYEEGEATLRFPLVVAPRYIPGVPLNDGNVGLGVAEDTDAVPDASRITPPVLLPGYPFPVRLDIQVSLAKKITPKVNLPVKPITHEQTHTSWQVLPGQKLDRDFIFRFPVASESIVSQCMIAPDADNPQEGTLALTVVPPRPSAHSLPAKPRRLVFVLDRSGSMSGWKMVAARRSLGRMIDTLHSHDHFAILAFDNVVEALPKISPHEEQGHAWYAGTDSQRFRSIEALAKIEARGGTEMDQPLVRAAEMLHAHQQANEERILVFITDGQVGNEDHLLQQLQGKLNGIRVFTLGIDSAVNEGFLHRLAQRSAGGLSEMVESEARLDEVMLRIHRRIASPVLTNFSWKREGIPLEEGSIVPDQVTDLFPETPIVILCRCVLTPTGQVMLHGTDDAGRPWEQTLTPQVVPSPVVMRSWARAKVRAMEDDYAANGLQASNSPDLIVKHSLKYQVLSRFTSFIAVDRSEVVNSQGAPREIVQAVEYPAGWAPQREVRVNARYCMSTPMACRVNDEASAPPEVMVKYSKFSQALGMRPRSPAENIDLTFYRERAKAMIIEFEQEVAIDPVKATGKLLLGLQKLIDDLNLVSADRSVTKPLVTLLEQLKKSLEPGSQVKPWKEDALNPLRNFAMLPLVPSKGKRWLSFWK